MTTRKTIYNYVRQQLTVTSTIPTYQEIATATEIPYSSVNYHITKLCKDGYLTRALSPGGFTLARTLQLTDKVLTDDR